MLEVLKESQHNIEILRRHEAYGGFGCFAQALLMRRVGYTKQRTNNYFSWSPSYRSE